MERMIGYLAAMVASVVGWQLGRPLGEFAGFFTSILAAALGLYFTRRWLRDHIS